jgi:hypothetical protein
MQSGEVQPPPVGPAGTSKSVTWARLQGKRGACAGAGKQSRVLTHARHNMRYGTHVACACMVEQSSLAELWTMVKSFTELLLQTKGQPIPLQCTALCLHTVTTCTGILGRRGALLT